MIALDTNILVYAHRQDSQFHPEARLCIQQLAETKSTWCICFHNFIEFYGIATHSKVWPTPSTPAQAMDQINAWRESPSLRILTETAEQLDQLSRLATSQKVTGPLIHDARIASCCLINGVTELWTIDRDFSRFPQLKTKNPL
ncbi:MAG: TA system VapC family ribonuclease toxin [Verrucomicrobiota bacterium]